MQKILKMILKDIAMMTFYYMTFGDLEAHGKNITKKVLHYGIEGTENAEARKDLEELYAWFHTFQFGNNVDMNNDSDLKSINQELHQIFGPRRILGRDSDKSIGKMYTVDEKMEETGGFRNLASEYSGMLFKPRKKF